MEFTAKVNAEGKAFVKFLNKTVESDWDEFLPIISFNSSKFDKKNGEVSKTKESCTLSSHLDSNVIKVQNLQTEKRNIKIPFNVKKGSSDSKDDDGIINIKLSNNKGFKIVNSTKIKTKYGSIIEVEIEIDAKEKVDTYLNFYSVDNKDDTWNTGEYENVYCGCFKLTFDYCVCTDWSTVAPIIPKGKFIGWGHTGITQNCYHYSLEQLRQAGHWVKSERWNKKWDGTKEVNDHIYQIFLEADVAGMTKGVQKDQFKKGVEYLKKTIKNKIPVMVGVDDDVKLSNDDETTEHFVVIVGMGSDTNGNYFLFYDNAVPNSSVGASSDNKLYCKCKDSKLEGTGSLLNRYIQINTSKKKYVVTQIRETK